MFTTLLVIGGILVGLVVLLAVIVGLSARPKPGAPSSRTAGWVADDGRPHPDAWSPPTGTMEIPTVN